MLPLISIKDLPLSLAQDICVRKLQKRDYFSNFEPGPFELAVSSFRIPVYLFAIKYEYYSSRMQIHNVNCDMKFLYLSQMVGSFMLDSINFLAAISLYWQTSYYDQISFQIKSLCNWVLLNFMLLLSLFRLRSRKGCSTCSLKSICLSTESFPHNVVRESRFSSSVKSDLDFSFHLLHSCSLLGTVYAKCYFFKYLYNCQSIIC